MMSTLSRIFIGEYLWTSIIGLIILVVVLVRHCWSPTWDTHQWIDLLQGLIISLAARMSKDPTLKVCATPQATVAVSQIIKPGGNNDMATFSDIVNKAASYASVGSELSAMLSAAGVETAKTDATVQAVVQLAPIFQMAAKNGVIGEIQALLAAFAAEEAPALAPVE